MSDTIAVALITALSTLAAAIAGGGITLLVTRTQSRTQLALADADRREKRNQAERLSRRDSYIQVLTQANLVEQLLNSLWGTIPSFDLANPDEVYKYLEPVTVELNIAQRLTDLVLLEGGPGKVSQMADVLQMTLTHECVSLGNASISAVRAASGKSPALQEPEVYHECGRVRGEAKLGFVDAAQEALRGLRT